MVLVATQVKRRRGTTAENDAFTGAEGEITVDTEKHELRVHDGMTQGGFKIGGGSGSGRNIGDIFMTKRTDSGLSGAVECNGGTYNTTDYEGDGSIGELLEAGKLDYISLTDYATAISTKGWCDKIGWNGAGTTSFKVPTLTPRIIQTNNIPVVGNGMVLGLKNATQNLGLNMISGGALTGYVGDYGADIGTHSGSNSNNVGTYGITTDGTKSGIIADTSDTAQLRVMFQLFNGTTDEAVATVGTVVAQVGALNTRTDGMIDYVIEKQEPTAENGYTWYRKYKSGWVEIGGNIDDGTSHVRKTISLPVEMANSIYNIDGRCVNNTSIETGNDVQPRFAERTTTSFSYQIVVINGNTASSRYVFTWRVSGMSAQ